MKVSFIEIKNSEGRANYGWKIINPHYWTSEGGAEGGERDSRVDFSANLVGLLALMTVALMLSQI